MNSASVVVAVLYHLPFSVYILLMMILPAFGCEGVSRTPCPGGCWNPSVLVDHNNYRSCEYVGKGFYSPYGDDKRYMCQPGSFSDENDGSTCKPCEPGSFSNDNVHAGTGAKRCQFCPPSSYSVQSGSVGCDFCNPLYYDGKGTDFVILVPGAGSRDNEPFCIPPLFVPDDEDDGSSITPAPSSPSSSSRKTDVVRVVKTQEPTVFATRSSHGSRHSPAPTVTDTTIHHPTTRPSTVSPPSATDNTFHPTMARPNTAAPSREQQSGSGGNRSNNKIPNLTRANMTSMGRILTIVGLSFAICVIGFSAYQVCRRQSTKTLDHPHNGHRNGIATSAAMLSAGNVIASSGADHGHVQVGQCQYDDDDEEGNFDVIDLKRKSSDGGGVPAVEGNDGDGDNSDDDLSDIEDIYFDRCSSNELQLSAMERTTGLNFGCSVRVERNGSFYAEDRSVASGSVWSMPAKSVVDAPSTVH